MTSTPSGSTAHQYLGEVAAIIEAIIESETPNISRAAGHIADTIGAGGLVHVFGTGHSHMLGLEMFYRAGGLAAINPILVEPLMLHAGARRSTRFERLPGLAEVIAADEPLNAGDVLIAASNSGGNQVCLELARLARERGLTVVAIVSRTHAASGNSRHSGQLIELADVVIDNHGTAGDAALTIEGMRVGPTSTIAGAAIVHAITVEAVATLAGRGVEVDAFTSSNLVGGDDTNDEIVRRYRGRVRSL